MTPKRPASLEILIAYFAAAILLVSAVFWADATSMREKTDFSVTYIGSRMVYLGQGRQLYDLIEQKKLKASLLKNAEPLIYEHPPFEALLLSPLGALPYKTAYLIWGLFNVAIWLTIPILLRPYAPAPREDLGYLALWLLFAPLGVALFQGQSSIILLLVYTLTFISLKQGRDLRAGLILGLGLIKFQFILPFVLIFLLRKQWRFLKGFLATAAGLFLLSLLAVRPSGILSYIHLLRNIASHPDNATYGSAIGMGTVQGFVQALLGGSLPPPSITILVAVISAALVCVIVWRWRLIDADHNSKKRGTDFDLIFASSIVVALVNGFHMFTHDLSPLLLAILLAMAHFPGRDHVAPRLLIGATLVAFWIPFLYFAFLAWRCVYLWFPILMVFLFGVLRQSAITVVPPPAPSRVAST